MGVVEPSSQVVGVVRIRKDAGVTRAPHVRGVARRGGSGGGKEISARWIALRHATPGPFRRT